MRSLEDEDVAQGWSRPSDVLEPESIYPVNESFRRAGSHPHVTLAELAGHSLPESQAQGTKALD
jgi:hypothetical protein